MASPLALLRRSMSSLCAFDLLTRVFHALKRDLAAPLYASDTSLGFCGLPQLRAISCWLRLSAFLEPPRIVLSRLLLCLCRCQMQLVSVRGHGVFAGAHRGYLPLELGSASRFGAVRTLLAAGEARVVSTGGPGRCSTRSSPALAFGRNVGQLVAS